MKNKKILFVGCGKMGRSLASAWTAGCVNSENVFAVEKNEAARQGLNIKSGAEFPSGFAADIVVLAVKPNTLRSVLPAVRPYAEAGALIFSIAAGKSIAYIEAALGVSTAVVRCMPNLAIEIKKGASGLFANERVTHEQKELITKLMNECAVNIWLQNEELLDAVTAVSGSSPAYMAYFAETLAAAGEKLGLKKEDALSLALASMEGTAKLLLKSKEDAAHFIARVATPGGTTEAAMKVLKAGEELEDIITRAAKACAARSKEIASEK